MGASYLYKFFLVVIYYDDLCSTLIKAAAGKYLMMFDVDSNMMTAHNNSENEMYRF